MRSTLPEAVRLCRLKAAQVGSRLIAVDTFGPFAGLRGVAENRAGDSDEAREPLREAAGVDNLGVVILRHDRKGGGEVGESARGSSALSGTVDIVLRLHRGDGKSPSNVRVIEGVGRFQDIPEKIVIELTSDGYIPHGANTAVTKEKAKDAVLEALPFGREAAIPQKVLIMKLNAAHDISSIVLKEAINDLKRDEDVYC